MKPDEPNTPVFENTQVFIVRIWREPRELEGAVSESRGVIEFIPGGERKYFQDLDELANLIRRCLEGLGWHFQAPSELVSPTPTPDQNQIPLAENSDATDLADANSSDMKPNSTA